MLIKLLKMIHLIGGVTFFGIITAGFFYIINAYRKHDSMLLQYAIKTSFFGDILIIIFIIIQYYTGTVLMHNANLSLATPWVLVAYIAFSFVTIFWFLLILLKIKMMRSQTISWIYVSLNILIILLFILIIHDAVMHATYFNFWLRK